jgi:hypothetical protein
MSIAIEDRIDWGSPAFPRAWTVKEITGGSVKNLGRYGASWIAWWPKRPSSTAALT